MITGVAIHGDKQYAFSSDPDTDALEHLEGLAGQGIHAFGFRVRTGAILLLGESLQTVILEASEDQN